MILCAKEWIGFVKVSLIGLHTLRGLCFVVFHFPPRMQSKQVNKLLDTQVIKTSQTPKLKFCRVDDWTQQQYRQTIVEWNAVRCGFKSRRQKNTRSKETCPRAQNMLTIPHSSVNTNWTRASSLWQRTRYSYELQKPWNPNGRGHDLDSRIILH